MALDYSLWAESFEQSSIPAFKCPRCQKGILAQHGKIRIEEPQFSGIMHADNDWEPDWITERFSVALRCPVAKCGETVMVIGETEIERVFDNETGGESAESNLRPTAMFPAPYIIQFPAGMPKPVAKELELAFQIYWTDVGACATKIRTSVERLMDHFDIPKFQRVKDPKKPTKPGKLKRLDLYNRIERFIKKAGSALHQDHLHALRVVGNLGTHQNELTRDVVLQAFEVYEHALDELIGKKSKLIGKLAKKLKKK